MAERALNRQEWGALASIKLESKGTFERADHALYDELWRRGLVDRRPWPRGQGHPLSGSYRYVITEAGRAVLASRAACPEDDEIAQEAAEDKLEAQYAFEEAEYRRELAAAADAE